MSLLFIAAIIYNFSLYLNGIVDDAFPDTEVNIIKASYLINTLCNFVPPKHPFPLKRYKINTNIAHQLDYPCLAHISPVS
jgi:hypothetical protein